jgi:sensor domain CHASE-containing protein
MLYPDFHANRSEYFTGSAILAGARLPTISVQTCLDYVHDEASRTRIQGTSAEAANIVGWVLLEDDPVLISYADVIRQGGDAVLLLANGTTLKVKFLDPNGTIQCALTN